MSDADVVTLQEDCRLSYLSLAYFPWSFCYFSIGLLPFSGNYA